MKNEKMVKITVTNHCVDCGKEIGKKAKRCPSCTQKGKRMSEETKIKISNSLKGEKNHFFGKQHTKESKKKMSKSSEGKVHSEETKQKMSESHMGRKGTMVGKHHSEETRKKMSEENKGENNPMFGMSLERSPAWKGGVSFEPYCIKFNEEYKEKIREEFNRLCFLCGKNEQKNEKKLSVHHINYDKDCGCNDTKCECVPLCVSCHSKTNCNREYWEKLIMEKKENGEYPY